MAACSAYGCTNRPSKKIPGISFHKFPKHPILRKAWIIACRRKDWMPSKYSHLCSAHFTEDLVDRTSVSCIRLRENAIPNRFKAFSSNTKNNKINKKSKAADGDEQEGNSNSSNKVNPQHKKNKINKKFKATDEQEQNSSSSNKVNFQHDKDEINKAFDADEDQEESSNYSYVNSQHDEDDLSSDAVLENTDNLEEGNSKKNKITDVTSSSDKALNGAENCSVHHSPDREEIFGQYVASEMRTLRDDPLLYLQTKQAILETLTCANFELINPE